MRSELKDRRKALKQRLLELSQKTEVARSPMADGRAQGGQDVVCLSRDAEAEIASIYAALRRMDQGAYGLCPSCGTPIPAERLNAVPFASHCGECAPLVY